MTEFDRTQNVKKLITDYVTEHARHQKRVAEKGFCGSWWNLPELGEAWSHIHSHSKDTLNKLSCFFVCLFVCFVLSCFWGRFQHSFNSSFKVYASSSPFMLTRGSMGSVQKQLGYHFTKQAKPRGQTRSGVDLRTYQRRKTRGIINVTRGIKGAHGGGSVSHQDNLTPGEASVTPSGMENHTYDVCSRRRKRAWCWQPR